LLASELTLTMRPQRAAFMPGTTQRAQNIGASALTDITSRQLCGVVASILALVSTPALLTRIATGAQWSTMRRCVASTAAASRMSQASAITRAPWRVASGCIESLRTSTIATRQPCAASASTTARPIVPPAPVTTATLSSKRSISCPECSCARTARARGT
jgi:hypothetical protein